MTLPLAESVEAILDAIVDEIQSDTDPTGPLEDIKTVVRGDRARPMPPLPAVWVVPQRATYAVETFGALEAWSLPVSIAVMVKSDDPDAASRLSQRLTARARAAALRARATGVEVVDVLSESFDPTARSSERNRNLFWTDATIRVLFTVDE